MYSISDSPISNILYSTWTAERCECSSYFSIHSAHSLHKIVAYSIKDLSQISMDYLWIYSTIVFADIDLIRHACSTVFMIALSISGTPLTAKLKAVSIRIYWKKTIDSIALIPVNMKFYRDACKNIGYTRWKSHAAAGSFIASIDICFSCNSRMVPILVSLRKSTHENLN